MRIISSSRIVTAAVTLIAVSGCQIANQEAPGFIGPSGLGTSFQLTASPDILPRDGASTSVITVRARGAEGQPLAGQTVRLSTTAGSLSQHEVTTDAGGNASALFTAPGVRPAIQTATITATPMGGDYDTIRAQAIRIALTTNSVAPGPSFTFLPEEPGRLDQVTFNASATTYSGVRCGTTCTYEWDFGDGTSGSGMTTTHRFEHEGSFIVTLTVTGPGGGVETTSEAITIGPATLPTVVITVSPTDPLVGQTVRFDGQGSTAPGGLQIVDYAWDFGNGETGSGSVATTKYSSANTFTVRLTVRDSAGRVQTGTTTVNVDEEE